MKKSRLELIIEREQAVEAILQQAAKLAGIAQAWRESEEMLSVDLQGIEAVLRQVAESLAAVKKTDD